MPGSPLNRENRENDKNYSVRKNKENTNIRNTVEAVLWPQYSPRSLWGADQSNIWLDKEMAKVEYLYNV